MQPGNKHTQTNKICSQTKMAKSVS